VDSRLLDGVGWVATAVFVASYFCARVHTLRRVQMLGAAIWVAYGIALHAMPVVAANGLVFGAAAWTLAKTRREAI